MFTAVAVVTIGVGIAATTAFFSVFDAVWLERLPFPEASRLVALTHRDGDGHARGMSVPNFEDLRERGRSFEVLTGFNLVEANVVWDGRPELATAWQVRGDVFGLLGLETALGRGLGPSDDAPGTERVVVLSHGYWSTRFGGDPDVVGKTLELEGAGYRDVERRSYTIVGVMTPSAWFQRGVELWAPFYLEPSERTDRAGETYWLIGRLLPDIDVAAARAEVSSLVAELAEEHPRENAALSLEVKQWRQWHYGNERETTGLLFGAATTLLLIACGNVAHLMMTRFSERHRELSVRAALGAGRFRMARLVLSETLLLSLAGGSLGWLLSLQGVRLAAATLPQVLVRKLPGGADAVTLDGRALGFTVVAVGIVVAIGAAIPLVYTVSLDLARGLKGSWSTQRRAGRVEPLVVSEIALSFLLLVGAGLTLQSSLALDEADLGFDPKGVMDFWVSPSRTKYPGPVEKRAFYRDVRTRVQAVPGIGTVGLTNRFPHQMWSSRHAFDVAAIHEDSPRADVRSVDEGYFRTMRIALRHGRHFDDNDRDGARQVAIVNRTLAESVWPNADPIGKNLRLAVGDDVISLSVVGVAADVHVPLVAERHPIIYRPWQQAPPEWVDVVVRSELFSDTLAEQVRRAIWSVDPNHFIELYDTGEGPDIWFHRTRFAASLLSTFSAIAFVLSATGVFAVVGFRIRRSRRELGIRKAVGAHDRDLTALLLGRTLRDTAFGIILGVTACWVASRYVRQMLYEVAPMDVSTLGGATFLIVAAAGLATYLPARRVRQIHPAEVLRSE